MKKYYLYILLIISVFVLFLLAHFIFPAKYKLDNSPIRQIMPEALQEKDTVIYSLDFEPYPGNPFIDYDAGLVFKVWYSDVMYRQAILSCGGAAIDYEKIPRVRCDDKEVTVSFENGSVVVYSQKENMPKEKITSIDIPNNIIKLKYRGFRL